jgi:hypothetical protein
MKKFKLEGAISEILVAGTHVESGAEGSKMFCASRHKKLASEIMYPTALPSVLFSRPEKGKYVCVPDVRWDCVWCLVLQVSR